MARDLRKKLRRTAVGKEAAEHLPALLPDSLKFAQKTADGRATFAGVYRMLFPQLCLQRKLSPKTAENYDAVMARQVLDAFDQKPFENLDEEDFLQIWKKLLKRDLAQYAIRDASIVIRGLMDLAFKLKLTQTILWGVPAFGLGEDSGKYISSLRKFEESDEGTKYAQLGVRIRRTISLETELKLVYNMLLDCEIHGELFAALFMIFLGVRTSEATAFSWKHFCEVSPGYWAMVRYEISNKDSRETVAGGKTNNAFRLIPVPRFLVELLQKRKKFLQETFPGRDLRDLPIACKGENYDVRCTQRELNQCMKYQYMLAGVQEELLFYAMDAMRNHPEVSVDCEKSATAYLGRHQFATAMVSCGLNLGDIYGVMGHKMEDENVEKADYCNPEQFRLLADKMSRRPLTQFFDRQCSAHKYVYDTEVLRILDDGNVEIHFPAEASVRMTVMGRESGAPLELEMENFDVAQNMQAMLPRNDIADTISIRHLLFQCAQRAWQQVCDKAARAAEVVKEDQEPAPEVPVIAAPTLTLPVVEEHSDLIPPFPLPSPPPTALQPKDDGGVQGDVPSETAPVRRDTAQNTPEDTPSAVPPRAEVVAAFSGEEYGLVLADSGGGLTEITKLPSGQKRNQRGFHLAKLKKRVVPVGLLFHRPELPALILTPDGMLFRIPAGSSIYNLCTEYPHLPAVRALLSGGIMLQDPVLQEPEAVVVCLAHTGAVRKVSMGAFKVFTETGRRMVTLKEGERIVSACLCTESSDVLLVSRQGQALRLTGEHLRSAMTPGCELKYGIALRDRDRAAVCIPYVENTEYLIVKRSGHAVRLSSEFRLLSHGRNSFGVAAIRVTPEDTVLAVLPAEESLLLLSNTGRSLFIPATEIPTVKSPATGVITAKLRSNEYLITARNVPTLREKPQQTTDMAEEPAH